MKKLLTGIVLCLAGITLLLWTFRPASIEGHTLDLLHAAGFTGAVLPVPEKETGLRRYRDIMLDAEGFSTIGQLAVRYNPLSGAIRSVNIAGLELTGEIIQGGVIKIDGWKKPEIEGPFNILPDTLDIKHSSVSLLTETLGGLTFNVEFSGRKKEQAFPFHSSIETRQKNLGFSLKGEGISNLPAKWHAAYEISQGRILTPDIKLTRASGVLKLRAETGKPLQFEASLRAGGISLYGFPWQNATLSIRGQPENYRGIISAEAPGYNGLALKLGIERKENSAIGGIVKAHKLSDFLDYLTRHSPSGAAPNLPETLQINDNATIEFLANPKKKLLIYRIKNSEQKTDIQKRINLP